MLNANTTLGKGLKTLVWVIVANAIIFGLTYVTQYQEFYNPQVVSAANVVLVLVKNFLDPKVKNM